MSTVASAVYDVVLIVTTSWWGICIASWHTEARRRRSVAGHGSALTEGLRQPALHTLGYRACMTAVS